MEEPEEFYFSYVRLKGPELRDARQLIKEKICMGFKDKLAKYIEEETEITVGKRGSRIISTYLIIFENKMELKPTVKFEEKNFRWAPEFHIHSQLED